MLISAVNTKIKYKMIFSHITTILIVVLLIAITIYNVSVSLQLQDARKFDRQMVNLIGNTLDEMIMSYKKELNYISTNKELQKLLGVEYQKGIDNQLMYDINAKLESILLENTIFIDNIHTIYLYDTKDLRVQMQRQQDYNGISSMKISPVINRYNPDGKVTWETEDGKVFFNRAIRDLNSRMTVGYLTIVMTRNYVEDKLNSVQSNTNRFIVITDETGNIVAHNYKDDLKLKQYLQGSDINGLEGSSTVNIEGMGPSLVTTYKALESGWNITSFIALDELTRGPAMMARWILIIGVVGVLLGVAISLIGTGKIVKPLKSLTKLVDQVEQGNFKVQTQIMGRDELGRLGRSLNKMITRIDNLISQVYEEEIKLKNAEIKALQAQINPHFLYNTLECINWLSEYGKTEEIRSVTIALANLLKASANNRKKMVTVREEINYITDYLKIHKISLQEKLNYYMDIEESVMEACIPKLVLQPIVENAIVHGIKKKVGPGNLQIKGFCKDNKLVFQIFDDGIGMSKSTIQSILNMKDEGPGEYEENPSRGVGSGLRNIIERIRLIYGKDCEVSIESSEGIGTMIEISMNLHGNEVG